MMTLSQYLSLHGMTQARFAEALGVNQGTVSKLIRRKVRPSIDMIAKIDRATGGAVPFSVWVDGSPERPA